MDNFFPRPGISLCILFFKSLLVLEFQNDGEGGLKSNVLWEGKLKRNAYNMCSGSFGGVKDRDLICV